jgi:hypothetical protein
MFLEEISLYDVYHLFHLAKYEDAMLGEGVGRGFFCKLAFGRFSGRIPYSAVRE